MIGKLRLWTFWDYGGTTRNLIEGWCQDLESDDARRKFNAIVKNNSKIEIPSEWNGWRGFLRGEKYQSEGIWELGFKADKRQYRILGVFNNVEGKAVILMGCYHKMNIYTPQNALDTAYNNAKKVRVGEARLYERTIRTDI